MIKTFLDRGEGKDLVTKVAAVFSFNILDKKGGKVIKQYTIDLKSG
jgi:hypothetical protein